MAEATPNDTLVPQDVIPRGSLPPLAYRDLPAPPKLFRLIGPGIILAGLALGSGEFVLWPYITYKSQFVFFWACLVGVTIQYFLNMEIARWTLATGETAVTGFIRLGKWWAVVFLLANLIPYMLPAWAVGAAKLASWFVVPPTIEMVNGTPQFTGAASGYVVAFSVGSMLLCGIILTAGPVIYNTVERLQMVLVALVLVLVLVIAILVVRADAITALVTSTVTFGNGQFLPDMSAGSGTDAAMLLGALAFAGAGGTLNLGQSNYIKDKGFGMGAHIGRITSPITGKEEPITEVGYHFHHTPENLQLWRRWWRLANWEHFLSFYLTCAFCLVVLTLISYSLFYTPEGSLRGDADHYGGDMFFIYGEANELRTLVGSAARWLFIVMGIAILLTTEFGVLDAVSRVATDLVKVAWLRDNQFWTESRLYYAFLWGEILVGSLTLLVLDTETVEKNALGFFKYVSAMNGGIMCIYSATLLWLNCRYLPKPLRMSPLRMAVVTLSFFFFGTFAVWAVWSKIA